MHQAVVSALIMLAVLTGCSIPERRADFRSRDPQERALAVAEASRANDRGSIPALIQVLDDPDPALRMLAINALHQMTGLTLGYDHTAPRASRDAAVRKWVQWVREQGLAPSLRAESGD